MSFSEAAAGCSVLTAQRVWSLFVFGVFNFPPAPLTGGVRVQMGDDGDLCGGVSRTRLNVATLERAGDNLVSFLFFFTNYFMDS